MPNNSESQKLLYLLELNLPAFQNELKKHPLSPSDLSWLLVQTVVRKNTQQTTCVLNAPTTAPLNILPALQMVVAQKHLKSLNNILPYATEHDIQHTLGSVIEHFNAPVLNTVLKHISANKQEKAVETLLSKSVLRRNIKAVALCLTHHKAPPWQTKHVENALIVALTWLCVNDRNKDAMTVLNYCMTYYASHPKTTLDRATQVEIVEALNTAQLIQWVQAVPKNLGVQLLATVAFRGSVIEQPEDIKTMHLLFDLVSVADAIQYMHRDKTVEAAEYLSEHYAQHQQKKLTTELADIYALKPNTHKRKM